MSRHSSYPLQRGFMLIEAIVFVSVLLSLMSLGARFIIKNAENTVNQVTAQQLQQVTQAAQYYVQDHYQDFKNNPNLTLTWQQLVDTGYLPNLHRTEESAESGKNHYGQNYVFTVREEKGALQLLLTTEGGNPIDERSLRQIAALAGSTAGYASVLDNGKIVGNQQSWVLDGIPLQPGRLASLTLVNEKEVMDAATFLRRTDINGHPEYNTMETSLTIAGGDDEATLSSNQIRLSSRFKADGGNEATLSSNQIRLLTSSGTGVKSIGIGEGVDGTFGLGISHMDKNGSNSIGLTDNLLKFSGGSHDIIKLSAEDPSVSINNSKSKIEMRPDGVFIDNKKIIPEQKLYEVNDLDEPDDMQGLADHIDCDNNQGKLFLVSGYKNPKDRRKLLVCIWRPPAKDGRVGGHHNFIVLADSTAQKYGQIYSQKMFNVGSIDSGMDLQRVADELDCDHNEGLLFLVGDNKADLRKKLLVCIWRGDGEGSRGKHNFLVVAEGTPPKFTDVHMKYPEYPWIPH